MVLGFVIDEVRGVSLLPLRVAGRTAGGLLYVVGGVLVEIPLVHLKRLALSYGLFLRSSCRQIVYTSKSTSAFLRTCAAATGATLWLPFVAVADLARSCLPAKVFWPFRKLDKSCSRVRRSVPVLRSVSFLGRWKRLFCSSIVSSVRWLRAPTSEGYAAGLVLLVSNLCVNELELLLLRIADNLGAAIVSPGIALGNLLSKSLINARLETWNAELRALRHSAHEHQLDEEAERFSTAAKTASADSDSRDSGRVTVAIRSAAFVCRSSPSVVSPTRLGEQSRAAAVPTVDFISRWQADVADPNEEGVGGSQPTGGGYASLYEPKMPLCTFVRVAVDDRDFGFLPATSARNPSWREEPPITLDLDGSERYMVVELLEFDPLSYSTHRLASSYIPVWTKLAAYRQLQTWWNLEDFSGRTSSLSWLPSLFSRPPNEIWIQLQTLWLTIPSTFAVASTSHFLGLQASVHPATQRGGRSLRRGSCSNAAMQFITDGTDLVDLQSNENTDCSQPNMPSDVDDLYSVTSSMIAQSTTVASRAKRRLRTGKRVKARRSKATTRISGATTSEAIEAVVARQESEFWKDDSGTAQTEERLVGGEERMQTAPRPSEGEEILVAEGDMLPRAPQTEQLPNSATADQAQAVSAMTTRLSSTASVLQSPEEFRTPPQSAEASMNRITKWTTRTPPLASRAKVLTVDSAAQCDDEDHEGVTAAAVRRLAAAVEIRENLRKDAESRKGTSRGANSPPGVEFSKYFVGIDEVFDEDLAEAAETFCGALYAAGAEDREFLHPGLGMDFSRSDAHSWEGNTWVWLLCGMLGFWRVSLMDEKYHVAGMIAVIVLTLVPLSSGKKRPVRLAEATGVEGLDDFHLKTPSSPPPSSPAARLSASLRPARWTP